MTARAGGAAVLGAVLIAAGWRTNWPELTALGTAALSLVVMVALLAGRRPRATVTLSGDGMRATRGDPAEVRMSLQAGRRRRWLRLVAGSVASPAMSLGLPPRGNPAALRVPLDTSARGRRPIGPYSLVHGDPWSLVRRVVARVEGGTLTVVPRTYPLRRAVLSAMTVDESELSSRRAGDQHFHALRDYVLGDEPRMIHWRSSARAGRLVVRQQVSAATNGTTVVLDCDMSAYGSGERFGSGFVGERFEAAVEVAASLCVADVRGDEQVHLLTSRRESTPLSVASGATSGLLDALADVRPVAPVETAPEGLPQLVRRTRCARALLVTGTPGPAFVESAQRIRRSGASTLLIRVGSPAEAALPALRVIDIQSAAELQ